MHTCNMQHLQSWPRMQYCTQTQTYSTVYFNSSTEIIMRPHMNALGHASTMCAVKLVSIHQTLLFRLDFKALSALCLSLLCSLCLMLSLTQTQSYPQTHVSTHIHHLLPFLPEFSNFGWQFPVRA